jgi:conjugal transfer pilin signal peptidase TrbI
MRIRGFWISPYWTRALLLSGMAIGLMWLIFSHTKIHFNRTDSSPYKVFICTDIMSVNYGDHVSIEGHQAEYFSGLHYTKQVAGLPGDVIEIKEGNLYVDGGLIGPLLPKTTQGLKLTPLAIGIVPQGSVFVIGDHPRSFDSRYQEFGLVKTAHIKGRCFGICKRKAEQA